MKKLLEDCLEYTCHVAEYEPHLADSGLADRLRSAISSLSSEPSPEQMILLGADGLEETQPHRADLIRRVMAGRLDWIPSLLDAPPRPRAASEPTTSVLRS